MAATEIQPQKINKPIQLLAAWLAGLAIVDGAFLTAAAAITTPPWIPGLLAIAAVVNVSAAFNRFNRFRDNVVFI